MTTPFNPLDKINLGKSVAQAIMESEIQPLVSLERFEGAGIYALFYTGPFSSYAPIAASNQGGRFTTPIYVGSAVPPGGRRGGIGLGDQSHTKLFGRLMKHRQSIEQAENLNLTDFHCRFLLVDDIWIPLGESLLIAGYTPLWNQKLDGFGNHDPGGGKYNQERSLWDTLHPGRPWALKCRPRKETQEQIKADLDSYLRTAPLPSTCLRTE